MNAISTTFYSAFNYALDFTVYSISTAYSAVTSIPTIFSRIFTYPPINQASPPLSEEEGLSKALENEDFNLARLSLRSGADIDKVTKAGATLLEAAISNGRMKTVRFLVENGANVNKRDALGMVPLVRALYNEDYGTAAVLLQAGADPLLADLMENTLFHFAAEIDDETVMKVFLQYPCDPNKKNLTGRTALDLAICNNNRKAVEILLKKGANPNILKLEGSSLLHEAIQRFVVGTGISNEIIKLLIEHGADLNNKDEKGDTPLLALINRFRSKTYDIIEEPIVCMLKRGVNLNEQNIQGDTPLHIALREKNMKMAKLLVHLGADPNLPNKKGETSFQIAKLTGNPVWIQLFIKQESEEVALEGQVVGECMNLAIGDLRRESKPGWQEEAIAIIKSNRFSEPIKEYIRLETVGAFDLFSEETRKNLGIFIIILGQAREIQKIYQPSHYVFFHAQSQAISPVQVHFTEAAKAKGRNPPRHFKLLRPHETDIRTAKLDAKHYLSQENINDMTDPQTQFDLISCSGHLLSSDPGTSMLDLLIANSNITPALRIYEQAGISAKATTELRKLSYPEIGNIIMICIPKNRLDEVCYRSHSYGVPCRCFNENDSKEKLEKLQSGSLDSTSCIDGNNAQFRIVYPSLDTSKGDRIFRVTPIDKDLKKKRNQQIRQILRSHL